MEEYKSREYCRDIDCETQRLIDKGHWIAEETCKHCRAYKFHDWIKKNGYKIIKA